jgi:predicted  nucleic acid-binding Zn-ribbon protein
MKKVVMVCMSVGMMASCVQNSTEYKQMKAENDSLKLENTRYVSELNEMLSTLNDIEADIQSIRDAEHYLTLQQQGGELTPDARKRIRNNMRLIGETLTRNREQISQLEKKLENGTIQSTALRKTINRLTSELEQKATMMVALQEDLANKNIRIEELDQQVASLKEDVEGLSLTATTQAETLKEQDQTLHTAYYCFGTSKELKSQRILSGGGLFSKSKALQGDFNRDYFISIDIREVTEIPLFALKATLKSNHPAGSYELVKDEDKNLTFKITDAKAFWSLGKYLVIEVG